MIPTYCHVKHDPENSQYGDCLRAALASILELDTLNVPHFVHDDAPAEIVIQRMRDYLSETGMTLFLAAYPGDGRALDSFLADMNQINPGLHYMLVGATSDGGPHVVVCCGDQIVHNPAWHGCAIKGPIDGIWQIMVVARK